MSIYNYLTDFDKLTNLYWIDHLIFDINYPIIYNQLLLVYKQICTQGDLELLKKYQNDNRTKITLTIEQPSIAALNGYLDLLKYFRQNKIPISYHSFVNACSSGYLDIAEWLYRKITMLLSSSEDLGTRVKKIMKKLYYPALIAASKNGYLEVIEYLHDRLKKYVREYRGSLTDKRKLQEKDYYNWFPIKKMIYEAAENGYLEIIKYIFSWGVNIKKFDITVFYVLAGGYYDVFNWFLENHRETFFSDIVVKPNAKKIEKMRPLAIKIAENAPLEMIEKFWNLFKGEMENRYTIFSLITIYAIYHGRTDITDFILGKFVGGAMLGAAINKNDFLLAKKIYDLFIKYGKSENIIDDNFKINISRNILENGNIEMFEWFLDNFYPEGKNKLISDFQIIDNLEMVKYLHKKGHGLSGYEYIQAIRVNNLETIKYLQSIDKDNLITDLLDRSSRPLINVIGTRAGKDILDWLYLQGLQLSVLSYRNALSAGNLEALEWIYEKTNFEKTDDVIKLAVEDNHPNIFFWAIEKKFPVPNRINIYLNQKIDNEFIKYLYKNNYKIVFNIEDAGENIDDVTPNNIDIFIWGMKRKLFAANGYNLFNIFEKFGYKHDELGKMIIKERDIV